MNTSILIGFFILVLANSCNTSNNDISSEWVKSQPISDSELHAKRGDCFSFIDSTGKYFVGTVMNFNKSNGGIWYAICFANYYDSLLPNEKSIDTVKWNARKYGYKNLKDRVVGFQVTWARDTLVDKHRRSILGNPNIQGMENWEIAGEGSALNFSQFLNDFDFYKTERLYPMKYEVDRLDSALSRNIYITFREAQRDVKNNELLKSNR